MRHFQVHRVLLLIAILLSGPTSVLGQERPPIKDNSFLIEEAYNQEPGVVQHIVTVQHFANPARSWSLAYTEELPVGSMKHQFSWTAPFSAEERDNLRLRDLSLNYRFQAHDGESGLAVAPRLSVILLSSIDDGPVQPNWVFQVNLPVSVELLPGFVGHLNAGVTIAPNAEVDFLFDEFSPVDRDLNSYFVGGSILWLVHPNANLLLEILHSSNAAIDSEREVAHYGETIVNPGIRVAINPPFGQFVPGIGVPIRIADGETEIGVFGYLSFEHSL